MPYKSEESLHLELTKCVHVEKKVVRVIVVVHNRLKTRILKSINRH